MTRKKERKKSHPDPQKHYLQEWLCYLSAVHNGWSINWVNVIWQPVSPPPTWHLVQSKELVNCFAADEGTLTDSSRSDNDTRTCLPACNLFSVCSEQRGSLQLNQPSQNHGPILHNWQLWHSDILEMTIASERRSATFFWRFSEPWN